MVDVIVAESALVAVGRGGAAVAPATDAFAVFNVSPGADPQQRTQEFRPHRGSYTRTQKAILEQTFNAAFDFEWNRPANVAAVDELPPWVGLAEAGGCLVTQNVATDVTITPVALGSEQANAIQMEVDGVLDAASGCFANLVWSARTGEPIMCRATLLGAYAAPTIASMAGEVVEDPSLEELCLSDSVLLNRGGSDYTGYIEGFSFNNGRQPFVVGSANSQASKGVGEIRSRGDTPVFTLDMILDKDAGAEIDIAQLYADRDARVNYTIKVKAGDSAGKIALLTVTAQIDQVRRRLSNGLLAATLTMHPNSATNEGDWSWVHT